MDAQTMGTVDYAYPGFDRTVATKSADGDQDLCGVICDRSRTPAREQGGGRKQPLSHQVLDAQRADRDRDAVQLQIRIGARTRERHIRQPLYDHSYDERSHALITDPGTWSEEERFATQPLEELW